MSKKVRIREQRPWIAFPGTPIQQNYGEALRHGYLLWDIEDRDRFNVKFCELPNPRPFVTIEWSGSVSSTLATARGFPPGSRFRIRSKQSLAQKEVMNLTQELERGLKASEVTFKDDDQVNRDVLYAGATTLAKEDLRNPDVLLALLKDYHKDNVVTSEEWDAVRGQVSGYLARAVLNDDDVVRNTKWSLRHLSFDNVFAYGGGNVINFDQLPGIVGIFGPNRAGKSSIVGTIMYSLFNTTDRGNVKNLHVINVRHPYCYTKAIVSVNGTSYVIERQTVKHENRRGQFHANTALNVFRIEDTGEATDLAGEERKDTEKVIRKLIGSSDDCLLTSVAAQDEVKQYINQGSTRRRQILSRFLDLDIFDRMYDQARDDVNVNKGALRNLADRDWVALEQSLGDRLTSGKAGIEERDHLLHDANMRLDDMRRQLLSFKDFTPVTQTQVEAQQARAASLDDRLITVREKIVATEEDVARLANKSSSIDQVLADNDLDELKRRLEAHRTLEASFESLRLVHEADAVRLKQQERSLKILDDVPCGDSFPTCRFIKDAHKDKERIGPQREKVARALEKLQQAGSALEELRQENIYDKVSKLEKLIEARAKLQVTSAGLHVELVKLGATRDELDTSLDAARRRLVELKEALKNEENVEVVTLRHGIDDLTRSIRRLDAERLALASEVGRIQSDLDKALSEKKQRQDLLQLMKVHELIANGFSRKGIPSLIVTSQLPIINSEVAKILHGSVDFNVDVEVDDDSDSMEVYINYGDSRRPIELGSGMEKMIASVAIRVALVNVSSLSKPDMFIIDEGFGALDDAAVEACNRLLSSLKRYFRTIIVITHVEGVKDIADHVIEINKQEKDSKVVYSETWPNDRTSMTA